MPVNQSTITDVVDDDDDDDDDDNYDDDVDDEGDDDDVFYYCMMPTKSLHQNVSLSKLLNVLAICLCF